MTAPVDRSGEAGETAQQARPAGRERGDAEGGRRPASPSISPPPVEQARLSFLLQEVRVASGGPRLTYPERDYIRELCDIAERLAASPPPASDERLRKALETLANGFETGWYNGCRSGHEVIGVVERIAREALASTSVVDKPACPVCRGATPTPGVVCSPECEALGRAGAACDWTPPIADKPCPYCNGKGSWTGETKWGEQDADCAGCDGTGTVADKLEGEGL